MLTPTLIGSPKLPTITEQERQQKMMIALLTSVLHKQTELTPEKALLQEMLIERHVRLRHNSEFICCEDNDCRKGFNVLLQSRLSEATFTFDEMGKLRHFRVHTGTRLAGSVRVWLEEENIVALR